MTSLDGVLGGAAEPPSEQSIAQANHSSVQLSAAANPSLKAARPPTMADRPNVSGLKPDQIAFLGEHAAHHRATSAKAFVHVLCWPTVPDAWLRLTRSCADLVALRKEIFSTGTAPVARSWIQSVAPQLSLPCSRDASAEESTLATLITRLPARFVAAVVEPDRENNVASESVLYPRALASCLSAYEVFLRDAHERARSVLITLPRKGTQGETLLEAFEDVKCRLDDDSRLKNFPLTFWSERMAPLPLEIANLAAAAISRYLEAPREPNPIFEAVASKMVNPPTCLEARRRR